MELEDSISREVAKLAAKHAASQRLGRPLTKDEQAFYDSNAELAVKLIRSVQKIFE